MYRPGQERSARIGLVGDLAARFRDEILDTKLVALGGDRRNYSSGGAGCDSPGTLWRRRSVSGTSLTTTRLGLSGHG